MKKILWSFSAIGLFLGCTSFEIEQRKIASDSIASSNFPTECQLNVPNVVDRVIWTDSSNNLKSATASCSKNVPQIKLVFANNETLSANFPMHRTQTEVYYSEAYGAGTFITSQFEPQTHRLRVPLHNRSVDILLNASNLAQLRNWCTEFNREVTVGSTIVTPLQTPATRCPFNRLDRSPIAGVLQNGAQLSARINYTCVQGVPKYTLSFPQGNQTHDFDVSVSDGSRQGVITHRRYLNYGQPGLEKVLVDNKSVTYKQNIYTNGRLVINKTDGTQYHINFDREILEKHRYWCQIADQSFEMLNPLATPTNLTEEITPSVPIDL